MDSNNWRQPSQTEQPPAEAAGGDWRSQLQISRHRIVIKIMDTLKSSGQEGVQELRKIAMRFEEKIYHAATSQSDYLRRISLKMLTMELKSNPPGAMPNAIPSNSAGMSRNPQDPASLDSTAQTSISESQEEVYQKIKELKNLYFLEIHEIYQKISAKIQQHEALSQQANSDGVDRLKYFKQMLERIVTCLQITRSSTVQFHKDKLPALEKHILNVLNSHRPRKTGPPLQQGQIPPSHMQSSEDVPVPTDTDRSTI